MRQAWIPGGPRRAPGGYVVPAGARLPALRGGDLPLHVGASAQLGTIVHEGLVSLASGVHVDRLRARHVILGAHCQIGRIHSQGDVVVQAGCRVQRIQAAGDVFLLGSSHVDRLRADGDIHVVGEPVVGSMHHGGRLTTREW